MSERAKFISVTRVIDPKTRVHYLDAVDVNGNHWTAEMSPKVEPWLVYTETWRKDPQQPCDL